MRTRPVDWAAMSSSASEGASEEEGRASAGFERQVARSPRLEHGRLLLHWIVSGGSSLASPNLGREISHGSNREQGEAKRLWLPLGFLSVFLWLPDEDAANGRCQKSKLDTPARSIHLAKDSGIKPADIDASRTRLRFVPMYRLEIFSRRARLREDRGKIAEKREEIAGLRPDCEKTMGRLRGDCEKPRQTARRLREDIEKTTRVPQKNCEDYDRLRPRKTREENRADYEKTAGKSREENGKNARRSRKDRGQTARD